MVGNCGAGYTPVWGPLTVIRVKTMYVNKEEALKLLNEGTDEISEEVKKNQDFLLSLLDEDDWSVIIKSHALIESLLTELIIKKTEQNSLKSVVERLPLSDEQIGKLKIAKDYGLLSAQQRSFVKKLSSLRNDLVHKFENIDFDLKTSVNELDKNQKKSWQKLLTWYAKDDETKQYWEKAALENPKLAVWFSVFMFVSLTLVTLGEIKVKTKINALANETSKKILDDIV